MSWLRAWEVFAEAVGAGYEFGLDDYLNDLDARQCLADTLSASKPPMDDAFRGRLAVADQRVRAATDITTRCLWGTANARENGWLADKNWWYFAMPRQRSGEFDADLARLL